MTVLKSRAEKNWELLNQILEAESSGKDVKPFSSKKTLFGIPSTLDIELAKLENSSKGESEDESS